MTGCGEFAVGVADLKKLAVALRSDAPVGWADMAGDYEVGRGRECSVEEHQAGLSNEGFAADVAVWGFHERDAPKLAAREAADERVALPKVRAEGFLVGAGFVEREAAGGLVLGTEGNNGRLVDDVRQVLRMFGREAIVHALPDVVQLVARVAIGEPGFAFLIGAKQVAMAIKGQIDAEAVTRAEDLARLAVGRDTEDRAALAFDVVTGFAFVRSVRVGEVCAPEAEVEVVVTVDCDAESIDTPAGDAVVLGPIGDDNVLAIGAAVTVGVFEQDDFRIGDDVEAFGGQRHTERSAYGGLVPELCDLVFEAVGVGVTKDMDAAVVAGGEEAAVGGVEDVVDVGEFYGQLADGEAGDEHADRRVIGGGDARCVERRRARVRERRGILVADNNVERGT